MATYEILARALAYPFPRPRTSIAIVGDRVVELSKLDPQDLAACLVRADGTETTLADICEDACVPEAAMGGRRTAVLAYGSNASPAGLGWKFPEERNAVVPLVRGSMRDLDVVYSSHIAVYGSVPATLQSSAGTQVETFVALLTDAQLELVAGWEINATYETVEVDLSLELGDPPKEVGAFLSRHGSGRRFTAMTQPDVLEYVRSAVAPDVSLDDFVVRNVRDYELARAYTAELRSTATPFRGSRRGDSNP
ncbi:MAG: hypothetical protein E6G53_13525 [Actinobacteria bacterium]|nr:MAG: hypothetical protein E6G53_13525 [Actinomycetota bacterium]